MRRLLYAAIVAATVMAMAVPAGAVAESAPDVVDASRIGVDWFTADTRLAGTLAFDTNYGGANSDAALVLSTPGANDKVQLLTNAHSGTTLASVTALSYWAYRAPESTGFIAGLPSLNLRVDRDNDGVVDTYLIYEPYQDYGNAAVLTGVWQEWDAYRGGAGRWWGSHLAGVGCGQATPCTWSTIVTLFPNARILEDPFSPINSGSAPPGPLHGSFGVNLGSGNPDLIGAVDGLTIGVSGTDTVYDFQTAATVPTFAQVRAELDALVAAGGITPSLEEKIRHALDTAEAWLENPRQLGPALSHLDRAVRLLEWQADVVERGKPNQGDPVGLRALADSIRALEAYYRATSA